MVRSRTSGIFQVGMGRFGAVRLLVSILCLSLVFGPETSYAQGLFVASLPEPGKMVGVSSSFVPVLLKGVVIRPDQPLNFDFILDSGNDKTDPARLKAEGERMAKYFLAALTVPAQDIWVNLSPYEKDRTIADSLGQTGLGRDMLAQDYILKQLTASLIDPEKDLGKKFWGEVYAKAQAEFGTTDIPVDTFNKVWISPDVAEVYEKTSSTPGVGAVYVTRARMKVMLEADYLAANPALAQQKGTGYSTQDTQSPQAECPGGSQDPNSSQSLARNILRDLVIPVLEKEVNEGATFAPLRQIYYAAILAKWYREMVQNSLLAKAYLDKNKIKGVDLGDKTIKEQIYQRYMEAYKKGVLNYIKEEPVFEQRDGAGIDQSNSRLQVPGPELVPRKYFSGGVSDLGNVRLSRKESFASAKVGSEFAMKVSLDTPNLRHPGGERSLKSDTIGKSGRPTTLVDWNRKMEDMTRGLVLKIERQYGTKIKEWLEVKKITAAMIEEQVAASQDLVKWVEDFSDAIPEETREQSSIYSAVVKNFRKVFGPWQSILQVCLMKGAVGEEDGEVRAALGNLQAQVKILKLHIKAEDHRWDRARAQFFSQANKRFKDLSRPRGGEGFELAMNAAESSDVKAEWQPHVRERIPGLSGNLTPDEESALRRWSGTMDARLPQVPDLAGQEPLARIRLMSSYLAGCIHFLGMLDDRPAKLVRRMDLVMPFGPSRQKRAVHARWSENKNFTDWLSHDSNNALTILINSPDFFEQEFGRDILDLSRNAYWWSEVHNGMQESQGFFEIVDALADAMESGTLKTVWPPGTGDTIGLERAEQMDWFFYRLLVDHEEALRNRGLLKRLLPDLQGAIRDLQKAYHDAGVQVDLKLGSLSGFREALHKELEDSRSTQIRQRDKRRLSDEARVLSGELPDLVIEPAELAMEKDNPSGTPVGWKDYSREKRAWVGSRSFAEQRRIRELRRAIREETRRKLSALGRPIRVGIAFGFIFGGGQYGKMRAIMKGLSAMAADIKFTLYGIDPSVVGGDFKGVFDGADVRDSLSGIYENDVVINIGNQDIDTVKTPEHPPEYFNVMPHIMVNGADAVDDNLLSPYSTMILDPSLRDRRQKKDREWSKSDIIRNRSGWLEEHLVPEDRDSLERLGQKEGWDPAAAVWSLDYHRQDDFIPALRKLIANVPERYFDEERRGRQFVVFVPPEIFRRDLVPKINKMGVEVIWRGERSAIPEGAGRLPVTIVVPHKGMSHDALTALIAEMSGTLQRSRDDSFWVDVPVRITGNASWAEAIAAGVPWVHDGVDAARDKMPDLGAVFDRYAMLSKTPPDPEGYGLFTRGDYFDPEQATRMARDLSDVMFEFNRLDDILAAAVLRVGDEPPPTPGVEEVPVPIRQGTVALSRKIRDLFSGREQGKPVIVGIDGDWGAGKTQYAAMFDSDPGRYVVIKSDSFRDKWRQGAINWTRLNEEVARLSAGRDIKVVFIEGFHLFLERDPAQFDIKVRIVADEDTKYDNLIVRERDNYLRTLQLSQTEQGDYAAIRYDFVLDNNERVLSDGTPNRFERGEKIDILSYAEQNLRHPGGGEGSGPSTSINGGIDITEIGLTRSGSTQISFNEAALREVMGGNFEGFSPVVVSLTPIESPLVLMGK